MSSRTLDTHTHTLTETHSVCVIRGVLFYGISFFAQRCSFHPTSCVCVSVSHRCITNSTSSPSRTHHAFPSSAVPLNILTRRQHRHTVPLKNGTHTSFIPPVCYHTFSGSARQTPQHGHGHLRQSWGSPLVCVRECVCVAHMHRRGCSTASMSRWYYSVCAAHLPSFT